MNIDCSCEKVIRVINDYLQGIIDSEEASNWALSVIRSNSWEELPENVSDAIHLLFDLHDKGQAWCPSQKELEMCKAKLEKDSSTKKATE